MNESIEGMRFNQNQFEALVSFTFDCGLENLKKLINNKNLYKIANELEKYNKINGKISKDLVKRRKDEKNLFLGEIPILPEILSKKKGDYISYKSIFEKTNDQYNFLIGNYNYNSFDLYCIQKYEEFGVINKNGVCSVVHILDGSNKYKSWLLHSTTPLKEEEADWDFCLGDYNNDGYLDLFCIKKNKCGTKSTEIHILSGKDKFKFFLLEIGINLKETDNNYKFCVGDYNGDGYLDLFYICKKNTKSKTTEVNILSGKSEYKSFLLQTGTILNETDDNWDFGVSNYFGNGNRDLYCINKKYGEKNCISVQILDGAKNYQVCPFQTSTKLHINDEIYNFCPIGKQLFMIKKQGNNNKFDCYVIRL